MDHFQVFPLTLLCLQLIVKVLKHKGFAFNEIQESRGAQVRRVPGLAGSLLRYSRTSSAEGPSGDARLV